MDLSCLVGRHFFSSWKIQLHCLRACRPKHTEKRLSLIFPRKQVDTAYHLDNGLYGMTLKEYSVTLKKELFSYLLFSLLSSLNLVNIMGLAERIPILILLTTAGASGGYEGARMLKDRSEDCCKPLSLTLMSPQSAANQAQRCPFHSSGNPLPKGKVGQS